MQKFLTPLCAVCVISLAFVSSAIAVPVTSKDLAGKTICWSNYGGTQISTYGPGDKYKNTYNGFGTWIVTANGVQIHSEKFDYLAHIQKLPNGTFTSTANRDDGILIISTGKYCKSATTLVATVESEKRPDPCSWNPCPWKGKQRILTLEQLQAEGWRFGYYASGEIPGQIYPMNYPRMKAISGIGGSNRGVTYYGAWDLGNGKYKSSPLPRSFQPTDFVTDGPSQPN